MVKPFSEIRRGDDDPGRRDRVQAIKASMVADMPYWPYCETCHRPFSFDPKEPFADCACGTTEWSNRPAAWVPNPKEAVIALIPCSTCEGNGWVAGVAADPLPSGEPGEPYQIQRECPTCASTDD